MRVVSPAAGARLARNGLEWVLGTVRFDVQGEEHHTQVTRTGSPVIFVLWHGRLLPLTYLHRRQNVATMISRSGDGEYIARIVEQWGYVPVRGSSSRGGSAALRELVRHLRSGRSAAITPDGPRGPRQKLKPGALVAAQLTGAPLIPAVAGSDRAWWFEGWDRFLVPKPFSRVRVAYAAPVYIDRDADAGVLERSAQQLEATLNALQRQVDGDVGLAS